MTDRELLELAAKAAEVHTGFINEYGGGKTFCWNPLLDDGDTLRLAVKLGIKVRWHAVLNHALAWPGSLTETLEVQENGEDHKGDKFAATRRAIVRAAAEIGRAMP